MDYTSYIRYTSSDYSSALLDTAGELVIWMLISAALVILAGLQLWIRLRPHRLSILRFLGGLLPPLFGAAAFTAVAGWLVAMILVWVFWSNPFGLPDWMETTWFVFGAATVIIYAAFFLGIQWSIDSLVRKLADDVKLQRSLLLVLFSMAVANSVTALAIWPIWAVGIIGDYRQALALAGGSSCLILVAGSRIVHQKIAHFEAAGHNETTMA